MSEKEKFIQNIQFWVSLDNQLRAVQEKIKEMRERKHNLSGEITRYIQNNQLQKKRIEISDGSLGIYEKKEYSALTYGYIEKCLGDIIPDKKNVEYIMNYLREHRELKKSSFDIRRNYNGRPRAKSINDIDNDTDAT
jgi:hypothetical protein